jgi:integrase/recombinase XerD
MSTLRQAAEDYLAIRRSLGFKLAAEGYLLHSFVGYAEQAGASRLTTGLAMDWAELPSGKDPVWCAKRLAVVRGFARHLQALDPATEVPPADLLPRRTRRATPYLYTSQEVAELMAAAARLRSPLLAATYETLIGLLVSTGLRVGEAIRLDRADIDWDDGVLTVVAGKSGRWREVPLHPDTTAALGRYARRRDVLCPAPRAASFFISTAGTRLIPACVRRTFGGLVRAAGLCPRSARCRPRIHDFRHRFAVLTLLEWYRAGVDVQARLPLLSAYLGHVDPTSTYWYLEATPELLALAAARQERVLHGLGGTA